MSGMPLRGMALGLLAALLPALLAPAHSMRVDAEGAEALLDGEDREEAPAALEVPAAPELPAAPKVPAALEAPVALKVLGAQEVPAAPEGGAGALLDVEGSRHGEEVRKETDGERPIARQNADARFVTKMFHPGDSGFSVNRFTGQIQCVNYGGQAYNLNVENGWHVYKLGDYYPYSEWRLESYMNGTDTFSVTFSNVPAIFHCFDLPMNWRDSRGRSCREYEAEELCTSWGSQGSQWPTCPRWNPFCRTRTIHDYKARNYDALSACCSCGGGWDPVGPQADTLVVESSTEAPASTTQSTTSSAAPTTSSTTQTTGEVLGREPAGAPRGGLSAAAGLAAALLAMAAP